MNPILNLLEKYINLNEKEMIAYRSILEEDKKSKVLLSLLKTLNEDEISLFYNTIPNGRSDTLNQIIKSATDISEEESRSSQEYLLNIMEKAKKRAKLSKEKEYVMRKHENLLTDWGSDIDLENILPEYPRPQMVRDNWLNLNGQWEYAILLSEQDKPNDFDGMILVPFPVESILSGVQKMIKPSEKLWYKRDLTIPADWDDSNILLHFGAIDWKTTVWINNVQIGEHIGGYMPFSFDISEFINRNEVNELLISVWDPTDEGMQQRGKQVLNPSGIRYTAVTGIWQTVWLEAVSNTRIDDFRIIPDIDQNNVSVDVKVLNSVGKEDLELILYDDGKEILRNTNKIGKILSFSIENPKLWSPENPFLYDLKISVIHDGVYIDKVDSYFGMRKIGVKRDSRGVLRIELNNKPIFQYGTLDQGWWPDGLYVAPTDDGLKFDIEITKKMGFNMIRKHVKVEPARWYHHCDKLGILVWQDLPSGGVSTKRNMKRQLYGGGREDEENRKEFYEELHSMIDFLFNSPSVIIWVPFNESWGQFDTPKVVDFIKSLDNTRLIDPASGWWDEKVGEIFSIHNYPDPKMPKLDEKRPVALTEFGGLGLPINGHLWFKDDSWGYRNLKSKNDLLERYSILIEKLVPMIKNGLNAAIYTQTTDCEGEVNGLLTYDRKIVKIDAETLKKMHSKLYESV